MLFDETLIELLDTDSSFIRIFCLTLFKMFCNEENGIFFNFNTDSSISLCARAHYLRYVKGKHQGHCITFSEFYNFVLV